MVLWKRVPFAAQLGSAIRVGKLHPNRQFPVQSDAHTVWSYRKDRRTHTLVHSRMITWSVTFRWKIGHVAGRRTRRGLFFPAPRFTYKFEFYLLRSRRRKRRNHKQLVAWGPRGNQLPPLGHVGVKMRVEMDSCDFFAGFVY